MKIYFSNYQLKFLFFTFSLFPNLLIGDDFNNNFFNNHGAVGLINIPTARFLNESVHGVTVYDGTPDQKITFTSSPYNWLEASFFYSNIQGLPYPGYEYQDYKDKGFNLKLRIKEEGLLPAIAVGLYDLAGTGLYTSEYLVSSYGINNLDMHFGLGWGGLNDAGSGIKNPLIYIDDSFAKRAGPKNCKGGCFSLGVPFSGKKVSPFYGISYKARKNLILKIEKDTTLINRRKGPYPKRDNDFSIGFDFIINNNFSLGASYERGSYFALKFVYKNDPKQKYNKYEFQKPSSNSEDNRYTKLIRNLEENGIGVNKIRETSRSLGLELTQFIHPDLNLIEEIIAESSSNAGINKPIKTDIKIANFKAVSELDDEFTKNSKLIYERPTSRLINTSTRLKLRPFIASREEFFKGALLLENDTEFVIRENLFFNSNLKYSLANNFDDLRFPPADTFPAQVRSDVKQYLKNMDNGLLLGRAQFDYHFTPFENHHLMFSAGILEDMFSGKGLEYLYYSQDSNYAFGIELFDVKKRDYEWGFGHTDYENITATANFYYRNYGSIPFDMKFSAGEYLAGDVGYTIQISRTFKGGLEFGAFATFTDVSFDDFGEGSFDKGIFFNIPIYGNLVDYTWRPLTKDPGAKLTRKNTLYEYLVRLRPIE